MISDDNKLVNSSKVGYIRVVKANNLYPNIKYFIDGNGNRYNNKYVCHDEYGYYVSASNVRIVLTPVNKVQDGYFDADAVGSGTWLF